MSDDERIQLYGAAQNAAGKLAVLIETTLEPTLGRRMAISLLKTIDEYLSAEKNEGQLPHHHAKDFWLNREPHK